MIMNVQDCFLVAFNNRRTAAQSGDLEKLGNSPYLPKGTDVANLVNKRNLNEKTLKTAN